MPRSRHYRVTLADAVAAHEAALLTGGRDGIWDRSLVLSAIGRPYSGYHRPIAQKAAALFQAIALNHGFVDGNKRTAVILTSLFIDRSGYKLTPLKGEDINKAIDDLAISVVCKHIHFEQLVEWFSVRLER